MKHTHLLSGILIALTMSTTVLRFDAARLRAQTPGSADIHQGTGNRLPPVQRETLTEEQKRQYDALVETGGPDGLRGAAGMRLHSSETGGRTGGSAEPRLVELAIINTAREENQQFEWTLHEIRAREAG